MSNNLARREDVALKAYTGGATLTQIADQLDVSVGGARLIVRRAMRKAFEPAEDIEEWRLEKVAMLEAMIDRLWPTADDPRTAAAIIRAVEKQADLLGLAQYEIKHTISIEQIREVRAELERKLHAVRGEVESAT